MKQDYVGNLPSRLATKPAVSRPVRDPALPTVESVALISDRDTGQPAGGFGFVECRTRTAARAIQNLNGHSMDGRA